MTTPLPATETMLADLIAIPSVSCTNPEFDTSNAPLCARLATFLEDAGCQVTELPVPGQQGKRNLIARFGSGPPGLALCGHTDTVPCDPSLWSADPFTATRKDERLYGLGSTDMKGFLAVVASVLSTLDPSALRRQVVVVGSADEESSMSGARALVDAGDVLAPFALIGEPTGMRPVRQHKGTLMEGIRLIGRAGHSSNPALGANAIDAMHAVIGELRRWREALQQDYVDHSFDVPFPTLNFGHIRGGDNPNRICGACELHLDLRLMPGMTVNAARAELRRRVTAALRGSDVQVEFDVLFAGAEPLSTARESALVRACERHSGCSAGSVNFCTEGPLFTQLGADTVIYGPGNIDVAHQPDEYLDLRALDVAQEAIESLVRRFCANGLGPASTT